MQFLDPGKRQGWHSIAAMGTGHDSKLLFITNTLSGSQLLAASCMHDRWTPWLTDTAPTWTPATARLYAPTALGVLNYASAVDVSAEISLLLLCLCHCLEQISSAPSDC